MVFPGPEEGSDFAEMLDVGMGILGGPKGLLTQRLSRERRLLNDLRFKRESGIAGGAVFLEISASPESLDENVKAVRRSLSQFSEKSVPEPLFFDCLVARLSEHHFRRQVRADYLLEIMRSVLAGEPADYGERYILNVRQLRIGEIVLAVQRYLGENL
jgi:hypothetical protein